MCYRPLLEEALLMRRDACGDRLPEGFLDVGAAAPCGQDRMPDRDGAAAGTAAIGQRAVFAAAPVPVVPDVLRLGADQQVIPVLAARLIAPVPDHHLARQGCRDDAVVQLVREHVRGHDPAGRGRARSSPGRGIRRGTCRARSS